MEGVIEEGEILSLYHDHHLPEMPQFSPLPSDLMPEMPQPSLPRKEQGPNAMPQPSLPSKEQGPDADPVHEQQEGARKEPKI